MSNVESKNPNVIPDPMLLDFFKRVVLVKPNLKFVFNSTTSSWTNRRSYTPSREAPPENFLFGNRYEVFDNGKTCGSVCLEHRYSRSNGTETVFRIQSHLINKSRGGRDIVRTADVQKAVGHAKKYLIAPTDGYTLFQHLSEAHSVASAVWSDLGRPINRGNFLVDNVSSQVLLNAYMTGRPIDPMLDSMLRNKLVTDEFDTALSEYYLSEWLRKLSPSQRIFIFRNGASFSFFSEEPDTEADATRTPVVTMEFEQLPTAVQERLGVLQLMKDREVVLDVGLRVSQDSFFVKL